MAKKAMIDRYYSMCSLLHSKARIENYRNKPICWVIEILFVFANK